MLCMNGVITQDDMDPRHGAPQISGVDHLQQHKTDRDALKS